MIVPEFIVGIRNSLALGPLVFLDTREWSLSPQGFAANSDVTFPARVRVRLARLLLEAGILLTPAAAVWDARSWYPLFRYCTAFSGSSSDLRLAAGTEALDPRLLAAIAEDVGVGVCGVVARDLWGVRHMADVSSLIGLGEVRIKPTPVSTANPWARPDYLGLNPEGEAVFFEAKGAIGPASRIRAARIKGKVQVRNVESLAYPPRARGGGPNADRVVIATHLTIDGKHNTSSTGTLVDDPPDAESTFVNNGPRSDNAIREAYAKVLQLCGQGGLAALLLGRRDWPVWTANRVPLVSAKGMNFAVAGAFPLGGYVGVDAVVWKLLANSAQPRWATNLADYLVRAHGQRVEEIPARGEEAFVEVLNNGVALLW